MITSRVSSLPEVAGDAAVMVDPADAVELAEAMHRVVTRTKALDGRVDLSLNRRPRRLFMEQTSPVVMDLHGGSVSHVRTYFDEVCQIASRLDYETIDRIADGLVELRNRRGRLFLLGVGGSAANCSHAVNDFRKLCHIEAYSPVDNVAELTARINDEGWETAFVEWLRVSRADRNDAVLILSVGGGDAERGVSVNLVRALAEARAGGLGIFGVVGRHGGYTKQVGDAVVVVPTVSETRVTPHAEAFQAVVLHCLVSHPKLQVVKAKWEGLSDGAPR